MTITSPAYNAREAIPKRYTCDGANVSPPFSIDDIPLQTVSLAIVLDDPDAPNGSFIHWLAWNIDPSPLHSAEQSTPPGATVGTTDFGMQRYGGPCPPPGEEHRYVLHVFALDTQLDLPSTSDADALRKAISGHMLEEATLVGLYRRTS